MKLLERILLAVDVNTDSTEQLAVASMLAQAYHSEILILYVIPEEELQDDIKMILTKAVSESLEDIRVKLSDNGFKVKEPLVAFGKPAEKIVEMADSENINVIIAGASTKREGSNHPLGVLAEQLIRMSDIPVWIVKPKQGLGITNILCPIDFSNPSKLALNNAIKLARKFQARLKILTVFEPITYISPRIDLALGNENTARMEKMKEEMNQFLAPFDLKEIDFEKEIRSGITHEEILAAIENDKHDLLIMGTSGRSGLSRFFMGSVTEKVIREVPCSFITTKSQDIIQLKLDRDIKEIEVHYKHGNELAQNGYYEEAINQYKICLNINYMHIPSMHRLSELYQQLGDTTKSEYYAEMAKEIISRLWDRKIEIEIRKHYRS